MVFFRTFRPPHKKPVSLTEQIVFYPSYGARTADGQWTLVIQGCVFDPRISWIRRRPLLAVVKRVLRFDRTAEEFFRSRMRQFLMFGRSGRSISIRLGDRSHAVGESNDIGVFRGEVILTDQELRQFVPEGTFHRRWISYQSFLPHDDDRSFEGQVQLIDPHGTSIISDVDDTIKHSDVGNRRALFRNTFTKTFTAIPGMPELYRECADAGAAIHFVSGSPWQLYEPLREFIRVSGYPEGSFHLKRFRIRDSARKLRRSPQKAHKRTAIEPLLDLFPQRKFLLIGDSGEQDPEIYGSFLRERPDQIAGVFIRSVLDEATSVAKMKLAFAGLDPDRWRLFHSPEEIHTDVINLVRSEPMVPGSH